MFPKHWSVPTPHTIIQRTPAPSGETDAYGNPIPVWTTTPRPAYGYWTPSPSDEPGGVVDGAVVADVSVICPTFPASAQDEFDVPGYSKPLRMEGLPQSYDNGPWGWRPGMRLNLRFVAQ